MNSVNNNNNFKFQIFQKNQTNGPISAYGFQKLINSQTKDQNIPTTSNYIHHQLN